MTRILVPFLLNDRLWQMCFVLEEGQNKVHTCIWVRKYKGASRTFKVISVEVIFHKRRRVFVLENTNDGCWETYFECVSPFLEFDPDGLPMLKGA